jgi:hypothetical protein
MNVDLLLAAVQSWQALASVDTVPPTGTDLSSFLSDACDGDADRYHTAAEELEAAGLVRLVGLGVLFTDAGRAAVPAAPRRRRGR